jgi:hypothetical protein
MKSTFTFLCSFLFLSQIVIAQGGWQRIYQPILGGTLGDGIEAVRQTADGGYIIAGVSEFGTSGGNNRIVKVDDLGNIQWTQSYSNMGLHSIATNIEITADGGYIIEGTRTNASTYVSEVYLQRIDANGNQLWLNVYPEAKNSYSGNTTSDGGYIQVGYYDNNNIQDTIVIVKTAANGTVDWLRKYPNTGPLIERLPIAIKEANNGDLIMMGYKASDFGGNNFLWRLSATGDSIWQQTYGVQSGYPEPLGGFVELADGSIVVVSNDATSFGSPQIYLLKTSSTGEVIWDINYTQTNLIYAFGTDIDVTNDGGFILTAYKTISAANHVILIKTDANGEPDWIKDYQGYGSGSYKSFSVRQTSDGGYIIGGAKIQTAYTRTNMYLIKTDSLGEIYGNTIQGNVFADTNADCAKSSDEHGFPNWMVKASGLQSFITSTDANGNYWMRVDTGNYQLTLHPAANNIYWSTACTNDTLQISIPQNLTTIDTSFAQTASAFCPLLSVDMGTPFLRRCFYNTYMIQYCNNGTADANEAFIDATFDDFLIVDTAAIQVSYTQIDSVTFRFPIGNIAIGECGSIAVPVSVSCNAYLGQTHCSEVAIYPNQSCLLPEWIGPSVDLSAVCRNDSAIFILHNSNGAMQAEQSYVIYADSMIAQIGTILLQAGETLEIGFASSVGSTYRINVNQAVDYPNYLGDSIVSITIEACGNTSFGAWVTQFDNYDGAPSLDIDCLSNIGAYDPNDKTPSPMGVGEEHFIYKNTDLEYLIRFQNTGTDTAFTIVVRDTISNYLDLASFQPGASSHSYTWRTYGDNVQAVEFTFNNIQLPDSFVNEVASHGFFKYRIKQKANVDLGSVINNTAAIYFDFNEPVITNTTFHTIGEDFIDNGIITAIQQNSSMSSKVKIYPNPFSTQTTFELPFVSNSILTITDVLGKTVKTMYSNSNNIQLTREGISKGMYFYSIQSNDKQIDSGKLIIQ